MPHQPLTKLWIWQESQSLYGEIHEVVKSVQYEFPLKKQADRSSQSVCDNIAEMFGAYYYKVKVSSLRIARKEAYETINHIAKFKNCKLLSPDICDELIARYEKLILGINKYIAYIKKRQNQDDSDK